MKRINNLNFLKERRVELRGAQTPEEERLWLNLRQNRIGTKFKRQHSVGPYILDFYCPSARLAVEIDGVEHRDAIEYDKEREDYLLDKNIKTIRFWNSEVNTDIVGVLAKIEAEINSALSPAKGEVAKGRRG